MVADPIGVPGAPSMPSAPASRLEAPPPQSLRLLLDDLGPLADKVGQYLACRPDVIPRDRIGPLLRLVDEGGADPWAQVRSVMSEDLGEIDALFEWINPSPATSGALAQVHLARTIHGDEVAVKIVRPSAADTLRRAISSLDKVVRALAQECRLDDEVRTCLGDDIRGWLLGEIDLDDELRNSLRVHDIEVREQLFEFPLPYPELCSTRVFTASHLAGVRLTDLMPVVEGAPDRLRALGIDRREVAVNVVEAVLQQVFALGPFVVAPHPSSLVALPGGRIGFVDVGFVDRIDGSLLERLLSFVSAVRTDHNDRIVAAAAVLVATTDHRAQDSFRTLFSDRIRQARGDAQVAGATSPDLAELMLALVETARDLHISMAPEVLSYHGAVLTADAVAGLLDDGSGLRSVADRFFLRLQVKAMFGQLSFNSAQGLALDVLDLVTQAPGQVGRLLADLADDRFILRVASWESDDDRRSGHARARLVSLAILFVGAAVLVTGPDVAGAAAGARVVAYAVLVTMVGLVAILWSRLR